MKASENDFGFVNRIKKTPPARIELATDGLTVRCSTN